MIRKTAINFYNHEDVYFEDETGRQYSRISGGFSWPVASLPGYAVIVGESRPQKDKPKHKPHFFVLAELEDFNPNTLIRGCIALSNRYHIGQWYGDSQNPMSDFITKSRLSFYLSAPPHLSDPNSLDYFISQIRAATVPGSKRLHFGTTRLGTRLLQVQAANVRSARVQDVPVLFALGSVLSALIAWEHNPREQAEVDALNAELSINFDV
jgi:hypothetical protein